MLSGVARGNSKATTIALLARFRVKWIAAGPNAIAGILLVLFFWLVIGLPFSWKKFHGDFVTDYVGFYFDYSKFTLGVNEKRTAWLVAAVEALATDGRAPIRELEVKLGRFAFAFLALEHLRPYLGPFDSWVSAVPRSAYMAFPKSWV